MKFPFLLYAQFANRQRDAVFLARDGLVQDPLPDGSFVNIPYGYGALKTTTAYISLVEGIVVPHVSDNQKATGGSRCGTCTSARPSASRASWPRRATSSASASSAYARAGVGLPGRSSAARGSRRSTTPRSASTSARASSSPACSRT